jgi:hypothetical protein
VAAVAASGANNEQAMQATAAASRRALRLVPFERTLAMSSGPGPPVEVIAMPDPARRVRVLMNASIIRHEPS